MKYNYFFVSSCDGKTNCVIRSFCKLFNEKYDNVYEELNNISKELKCDSFNDVLVFETYMKRHNTNLIKYGKDIRIKDLKLDNGEYIIFCWDKKNFYHIVSIIDNNLYDNDDKCLGLYTIKIYKKNV